MKKITVTELAQKLSKTISATVNFLSRQRIKPIGTTTIKTKRFDDGFSDRSVYVYDEDQVMTAFNNRIIAKIPKKHRGQ